MKNKRGFYRKIPDMDYLFDPSTAIISLSDDIRGPIHRPNHQKNLLNLSSSCARGHAP